MNDQARVGEAIAALDHRLTKWGVPDSTANATEFVNALLHQGWRPRALATVHPIGTGTKSDVTSDYREARDHFRDGLCSHGVRAELCGLHEAEHQPPPPTSGETAGGA